MQVVLLVLLHDAKPRIMFMIESSMDVTRSLLR